MALILGQGSISLPLDLRSSMKGHCPNQHQEIILFASPVADYANLSVILADITKEVDDINEHGLVVNGVKYTVPGC